MNVHEIAERQHGVFTADQVRAAGISRNGEEHRRKTGRWSQAAVGVLRVPGAPQSWEQQLIALTLAAGPGAAASHRSAAALLGIPGFERRGAPEVTTPRFRRHRPTSGRVRQSRILPDGHLITVEGIVTTNCARTLVDLAGTMHPGRVERALDNCLTARRVTVQELAATMAILAQRGRRGIVLIRELLDERGGNYVAPASELEARFLALITAGGLALPERQFNAGDSNDWVGRVDFAYPQLRLLIELDSRTHHTAKLDWESDRLRDNRLVAGGWRVLRITWDQIVSHPHVVLTLLQRTGVTRANVDAPASGVTFPGHRPEK